MNYNAICFCEKMDLNPFLVQFCLSERNMGIGYAYNILDHKNP